jgi:Tol biopolymer transport system component
MHISVRRAALLLALSTAPAAAQPTPRPHLDWRTLRTEHFDVHYTPEVADWAHAAASRLEAVRERVSARVGYAPARRVTVIVDDPANHSNGSAWPGLAYPAMHLWPTPPDPRSLIGHTRGFSELLLVHEYTHLAHMTRPSRNPVQRTLWNLSPVPLGPIGRGTPEWVEEGYATYLEGQLTGSGRPHGALRPAMLRQWALEGKLPAYGSLDATSGFFAGSQRYLSGSAFLEWLVAQRGDSSLVHLWRRITARQTRTFDEAFAGVYGAGPAELYARFTVDVTVRAVQARDRLAAAGLVPGDTVQLLQGNTGDPAISPDGAHIAIAPGSLGEFPRLVVWKTAEAPDTTVERARRALLARDPEDVAAVGGRPRPRTPVATLHAVAGLAYSSPRFLPRGDELLVTRTVRRADGTLRPELFVWSWKTGALRQVTHDAGVRDADPSPDGTAAVAIRCVGGKCHVVRVELASGAVSVLAAGSLDRTFARPRWSPDGRGIVASMQEGGFWRVVRIDATGGAPRVLGPLDGASRYDAAWTAGGALVAVSEVGGVPNVVRLDPETGTEQPLTRVTGAAVAPEPHPDGSVYFLSLSSRGYALHRVRGGPVPGGVVALGPELSPTVRVAAAAPADTLKRGAVSAPGRYGVGPQRVRLFPGAAFTSEGEGGLLALYMTDPVGRFSALLQGSLGTAGIWRGAGLGVVYRGTRPSVAADLFWAEQDPAAQHGGITGLDARYAGTAASLTHQASASSNSRTLRLGASAGSLDTSGERGERLLAFADAGWRRSRTAGARYLRGVVDLHGATGQTLGTHWSRGVARVEVESGSPGSGLTLTASHGVIGADAPRWERFSLGGASPVLFSPVLLSQRAALAGLPVGTLEGDRLTTTRATLRVGAFSPFFFAAHAGDGWYRVVGTETTFAVPRIPSMTIPSAQVTGGVLLPLDEPFRREPRLYLSIGFRP